MRNNTFSRITALLLFFLLVPFAWAQRADLSRLVVVGDSLSAGFQNGSLLETQQTHGYASLVAEQARTPLALPLVAFPGFPPVLKMDSAGVISREGFVPPVRTNPTVQPFNLAVPGHNVQDALTTRPGPRPATAQQILDTLVLGIPGLALGISRSQVEWAEALQPTTVILWIGNNDALGAATDADLAKLTSVSSFRAAFGEVIDRLAATGASLVVANIPDVTAIPFLTPAEAVAAQIGLPLEVIGPILGIGPGDFVTPDALPLIQAILGRAIPGPLRGDVVLDAREVAAIRDAIAGYNAFIAEKAAEHGAALVDIHALFGRVAARGVVVGGQRLTTAFLGGLFSLDGVHPTNTGYAVIANEFIDAMNRQLHAGLPPNPIVQVKKDDPLVLPGVGHPASALGQVSPEAARDMRSLLAK